MKQITLSNYRCFENQTVDFSEKINLIIGDNASGKTTILSAIKSVLSSFFVGFSDENTRFIGLGHNDFRIIPSNSGLANSYPVIIEFDLLNCKSIMKRSSKKGRTLQLPLENINVLGISLMQKLFADGVQKQALPLFASFSTSDIHASRKLSNEQFKKYAHKPSFGYYECLQGDGLLDYWTTRMLVLSEAETGEQEINAVRGALSKALGSDGCNVISQMHIRPIKGEIFYDLIDGRQATASTLSDGLHRLVNIVVDLAFRCTILNKGIYGDEACSLTNGTVLIDEIDLHLHPSLQKLVMQGLTLAFPHLQFIVTTHAPMVINGIPRADGNKIMKISYSQSNGYELNEVDAYGLDASSVLQAVLDIAPRAEAVESKLNTLFDTIDAEDYVAAATILLQLRTDLGHLPDLDKAQAMLDFMTDI